MSLSNVLKGMKEGFPKDQVVDDLNILRQDLATYTIPMFQQAEKDFGTRTFKSKYAENFHKHLKNEVRKISQKNFISPVLKALDNVMERIDVLEKLAEEHFNDDIIINAMSIKRINVLSYIQACTFFSIYARRLIATIFAIEINTGADEVTSELEDILPINLDWLSQRRQSWFMVLDIFLNGKGDITKIVDDLPEINVNPTNIRAVEAVNKSLDPFGFGFIPVVLNPAYHVGVFVAEWENDRLNTARAEKDVLEVRLINLKLLDEKKNDAKLQASIQYIEKNRLKPLYKKIAKMEEKYARG